MTLSSKIMDALRKSTLTKIANLFRYDGFAILFQLYRDHVAKKGEGEEGLYENEWYRLAMEELNEMCSQYSRL